MRMKKSEKELLEAVNSKNQVEILGKLAVIFTEDAIDYAKKSRVKDEDEERIEEFKEKKMKNLLNLQKVNSDILRLQDKYKGEEAEPKEGSQEAEIKKVISSIPQL